jgi:4-amino-4-deoxy-L-arabinose transferase-like glycosyltransferase
MERSLIVALIVSLFVFFLTYGFSLNKKTYWWDEAVYLSLARNLATKAYFGMNYPYPEKLFEFYNYTLVIDESFRQPLFPFLLSFLYWFGENIQRILSPLFAALTVFLTYILGKKLKDEYVGLASSLFAASSHYFLFFSSKILTESLSSFLFLLSFLLLMKLQKDRIFILPFGVTVALSLLTRYTNLLILIPFFFVWLKKKDFKMLFEFSIVILILLLPWFVFSHLRYGNFLGALIVSLKEVYGKEYFQYPFYYYFVNLLPIFGLPIFFSLFFLLNWKKENKLLLLTFLLVFIAFSILARKEFRYLVPYFPVFYLASAIGLKNSIKNEKFFFIVVLIVSIFELNSSWKHLNIQEDDSIVKAANFLKNFVGEGDFIIGENYPVLHYFTKAYVLPFSRDLQHFQKVVDNFKAKLVVIDNEITLPPYSFELENFGYEKIFEYKNVKVLKK